ncbi:hypothetical protein ABFS82_01G099400 [Erythranthe guttata]|nr:PREDICTED: uncharacterized protein LOC105948676 [Erythranthe guttata]|eukprot:XP_012827360.1 PREDICTED: uncharacterized protein LOC105948676 [Erythranthe guttata]
MDLSLHSSIRGIAKWRRRATIHHSYRTPLLFTLLITFALFFSFKTLISPSPISFSRNSGPRCAGGGGSPGEKFLWYAPHSGFSNQLFEFKNAVLMAAILNRTLIVPPILDHHAVALGSCPKFRVLDPNELRFKVWNHSVELIRDRRYISMADIIDLSSLMSSSAIRFIDFRVFVSTWCGVNINSACGTESSMLSPLNEELKQCGSLLSGYDSNMDSSCLFASQEDCRTTVWTYQTSDDDGVLDSFQADSELKKKRKIPFVRKRKDVYNALGPGSEAGSAKILSFGSLFSAPYKGSESHIDIHESPRNQRIQLLIQNIEFLPFVTEILNAGKQFARQAIKAPFLCAQLRLLDGQFKNHWKDTFLGLQQMLDVLKQTGSRPVHIFVMTDLPQVNWTGTYLGDLAKDSDAFKVFVLSEGDEFVAQTAMEIVNAGHSMKLQSVSSNFDGRKEQCNPQSLPDVLLYLEESICSCASLGFYGTAGSTIAGSIELMRKNNICS